MAHIIERVEAHYEAREALFGKVYEWHPVYVALECECGEELILTSTISTCGLCGAEVGASTREFKEREGSLPGELTHPWFHDARVRAEQHRRDEAAYPKGSPLPYDDISADAG